MSDDPVGLKPYLDYRTVKPKRRTLWQRLYDVARDERSIDGIAFSLGVLTIFLIYVLFR